MKWRVSQIEQAQTSGVFGLFLGPGRGQVLWFQRLEFPHFADEIDLRILIASSSSNYFFRKRSEDVRRPMFSRVWASTLRGWNLDFEHFPMGEFEGLPSVGEIESNPYDALQSDGTTDGRCRLYSSTTWPWSILACVAHSSGEATIHRCSFFPGESWTLPPR